jgi:hypothetical protein
LESRRDGTLPQWIVASGSYLGSRETWDQPGIRGFFASRNVLPRIKTTGHDSLGNRDSYSRSELDAVHWPTALSVAQT